MRAHELSKTVIVKRQIMDNTPVVEERREPVNLSWTLNSEWGIILTLVTCNKAPSEVWSHPLLS